MKNVTKKISVAALCIVMLMLSIMPAFASTVVEDHSVIHCTHYYKDNGNYYYQIKCPKGQIDNVTVNLSGSRGGAATVSFKYTSFTALFDRQYAYSDDNYDYTWLIVKCSEYPNAYESNWGGMIAKLYYSDDENPKMATNTSNGSTVIGPGYRLD